MLCDEISTTKTARWILTKPLYSKIPYDKTLTTNPSASPVTTTWPACGAFTAFDSSRRRPLMHWLPRLSSTQISDTESLPRQRPTDATLTQLPQLVVVFCIVLGDIVPLRTTDCCNGFFGVSAEMWSRSRSRLKRSRALPCRLESLQMPAWWTEWDQRLRVNVRRWIVIKALEPGASWIRAEHSRPSISASPLLSIDLSLASSRSSIVIRSQIINSPGTPGLAGGGLSVSAACRLARKKG